MTVAKRVRNGFFKLRRSVKNHSAVVAAVMLIFGSFGALAYLYVPTLLSDFGRVEFRTESDCGLSWTTMEVNLVDPPDAYITLHFEGFSRSDCNHLRLIDDTDLDRIEAEGFLKSAKYSDDVVFDLPMAQPNQNPFMAEVTKTELLALYPSPSGDVENTISDRGTISFSAVGALNRTSIARSVLPIFPGLEINSTTDAREQTVRLITRAPNGYVFSSSAPQNPSRLISREDGVIEVWIELPSLEPGVVIYFENARGAAIGELVLFLVSGVFGFSIGLLLEKLIFSGTAK